MGDLPRNSRAVLVFARSLPMDLSRRRWPRWLAPALRAPFQDASFDDADVHLFGEKPPDGRSKRVFVHAQGKGPFGVRLRRAIDALAGMGYREIVIVGRDCPGLRRRDVREAFEALETRRLALGPDHKGGLYLIALRSADRAILDGVRWRHDTDCEELIQRAGRDRVHLLTVKHDLDGFRDLLLLARREAKWRTAVQRLRLSAFPRTFWLSPGPALPLERGLRISWQLPPPASSLPRP